MRPDRTLKLAASAFLAVAVMATSVVVTATAYASEELAPEASVSVTRIDETVMSVAATEYVLPLAAVLLAAGASFVFVSVRRGPARVRIRA